MHIDPRNNLRQLDQAIHVFRSARDWSCTSIIWLWVHSSHTSSTLTPDACWPSHILVDPPVRPLVAAAVRWSIFSPSSLPILTGPGTLAAISQFLSRFPICALPHIPSGTPNQTCGGVSCGCVFT